MKNIAFALTIIYFASVNLLAQKNTQFEYDDLYFSKSDRINEKSASQRSLNSFSEPSDIAQPSLSKFANPDYDGGDAQANNTVGYYDENAALNSYRNSGYDQGFANNSRFRNSWNRPQWFMNVNSFGGWSVGFGTGLFNLGFANNSFGYNPWGYSAFNDPFYNPYGFNSFWPGNNFSCYSPYNSPWRRRNAVFRNTFRTESSFATPSRYKGTRVSRNTLASVAERRSNSNPGAYAAATTKYVSRLQNRSSSSMGRLSNGRSSFSGTNRGYIGNTRTRSGISSGRSSNNNRSFSFSNRRASTSRSTSSFSRSSSSRSSISRSSSSRSSSSAVRRRR